MKNKITTSIWKFIETVIKKVLIFTCKLFHIELSEKFFFSVMQFVKFGIVGFSNTIISYLLYAAGLLVFQRYHLFVRCDYLIAQIVAFILSVLWSFYWNNKMVFRLKQGEKRSVWQSLLKTYISYSFTGLFLNSILLILWVNILGISEFIAPIINLLISVPLNFIINKFWAFKKS